MLKVLQNHPIACNVLFVGFVFVMQKALQLFCTAEIKLEQLGQLQVQDIFIKRSAANERRE